EQEGKRTQESSNVDDRTQHEIYAHPFMRSVMADLVNDTYACNNSKTLNDIMKREFGFQGFIQSDWAATMDRHSPVTGLDMTMPGDVTFGSGTSYFGQNLTDMVMPNCTISMQRLDDMAMRIISAWYFLHQDEGYPDVTVSSFNFYSPLNREVNAQSDHYLIVREIGAAGTVLLKNEGALPLYKPKSIVLVGSDAAPPVSGPNDYSDQGGDPTGILAMGLEFWPYEAFQARARVDQTSVFWNFDDWNLANADNSVIGMEAAIVFVNSDSGEGYITVDGNAGDRKNLTAWHQGDELILAVAAQNNNAIVVINSVGPLIIEPWVDHPNVIANPSGKLPYTIAKSPMDYPAQLITGGTAADILSINYTKGLFIDRRWFDAVTKITPRYEFGFGLSYTTFEYSNLAITKILPADYAQMDLVQNWENGDGVYWPRSIKAYLAVRCTTEVLDLPQKSFGHQDREGAAPDKASSPRPTRYIQGGVRAFEKANKA
ncbi:glycoside hydrolase family 3 C-terminal domain-containing protein, partial [Suillus americanus]